MINSRETDIRSSPAQGFGKPRHLCGARQGRVDHLLNFRAKPMKLMTFL
jgi:hypothetical protein